MAHTLSSEVPIDDNSTKTISIIDEEDCQRMTRLASELRKAKGNSLSETCSKERGLEMVLRNGRKVGCYSTERADGCSRRTNWKRKRVEDWSLSPGKKSCNGHETVKRGKLCLFDILPKDLLFHICSFLTDFLDIARVRHTCRSFREIFSSNLLFPKLDFGSCRYIDDNMLLSFLNSSFLPFKARFQQVVLAKCHRLSSRSFLRLFECISPDSTEYLDIRWCTELDSSVTQKLSKLLKLKTLLMAHTRRISAFYLPNIFESLQNLKVLDLSFTNCDRRMLLHLNCRYLSVLILQGIPDIDDEVIQILSSRWRMIERIDLSWCPNVGNRSLSSLASHCHMLQEIGLSETKVSDEGLCEVIRSCPKVRSIQVSRCSRIRDSFIQFIVDNVGLRERLTSLDISSCHNISDAAVEELLKRCKNLRYVDVSKLPSRKISCSVICALRRRNTEILF